jgi:hypothetical protein
MSESTKTNVSKLLRVLVAGGVALAGVAGVARADEPAPKPAEKTEKAPGKDGAKSKTPDKGQDAKKPAGTEAKDAKAAEPEGGGVKGW